MGKTETALSAYLKDMESRGLKPATIKSANQAIGHYLSFLQSKSYSDFTSQNLQEFKGYLVESGWSLSGGIRTNFKSYIFPFCKWMEREGYKTEYIAEKIKLPPPTQKVYPVIPLERLDELIEAATETKSRQKNGHKQAKWVIESKLEHRDALKFMARTGLRASGVVNSQKEHIDFEMKTYRVYTKGKIVNNPIPPDQIEMLRNRCKKGETGPVFKVKNWSLNDYIHRGCKKLGISKEFVSHTIRHSLVTGLLNQGAGIEMVSKLVNHDSVVVTADIYANYSIEDKRRALNKNPMVGRSIAVAERFEQLKEIIRGWNLIDDNRIDYELIETPNGFSLSVKGA